MFLWHASLMQMCFATLLIWLCALDAHAARSGVYSHDYYGSDVSNHP